MGELENSLFKEKAQIIEHRKKHLVAQVNSTLTLVYWQVGNRINNVVLNNKRAAYGKEIITQLSVQLEEKYGRQFNLKNIKQMMRFSNAFTSFEIVPPLAVQLSWSHFLELIPIESEAPRLFYAKKAGEETCSIIAPSSNRSESKNGAKKALEIAIEESEEVAMKWVKKEVKDGN